MWYRRYWLSNLGSSGLHPLFMLLALGIGFGSQVAPGAATGGVAYLNYVAPALLVVGTTQNAVSESSFPVLSGFKWQKDYIAVTATPVTPGQLLGGQLLWVGIRVALTGIVFVLIALPFGAWLNAGVLAVVAVGVLTALACGAPIMAIAARTFDGGDRFTAIFRTVMTPMILFAGTFFPVEQIPIALRWLVWITPIWHGNELARAVTLGTTDPLVASGHAGYLLGMFALGAIAARRCFYRRLVV